MPLTPSGGTAPYCAVPQFLLLYDPRIVGQLARSDGSVADPTDLLTDPTLALVLSAASGDIELACTVGGRYAAADLAGVTGNGAAFLAKLTADLAYGKLRELRGIPGPDLPQVAAAHQTLTDLRDGAAALPFAEVAAAGLAVTSNYTPTELRQLDRPSDRAVRLFGIRSPSGHGCASGGSGSCLGWY